MNLRDHRRNVLRETLKLVADRAGIDLSVLSRLERDGKVSPYRVPALAKGYCLTVEGFQELLGGSKDENKKRAVRNASRVPRRRAGNAAVGRS